MSNIFKSFFGKSEESGDSGDIHKDPVCGMQVEGDLITAEYQEKNYHFCADHCKEQFVIKPTNFVD